MLSEALGVFSADVPFAAWTDSDLILAAAADHRYPEQYPCEQSQTDHPRYGSTAMFLDFFHVTHVPTLLAFRLLVLEVVCFLS